MLEQCLIIIVCAVLGWSLGTGIFARRPALERYYLATMGTVTLLALLSLFATRLGIYSLQLICSQALLVALLLRLLRTRRRSEQRENISSEASAGPLSTEERIGLLVLGALLLFYQAYPTYYLIGDRDPGPYLIFAAHIAKTGGLNLDLPWLTDVFYQLGNSIKLGYPGIYSAYTQGSSEVVSELVPQFMHLFPALAANLFAAWGIEGVLKLNALITVLALWSLWLIARRLRPGPWALVLIVLLGCNPALLWAARTTMTEPLALALLGFGLLLLHRALEDDCKRWAIIAGIVLGAGIFNRVDSCLAVLALAGAALSQIGSAPRRTAPLLWSCIAFLLCSSLAFADGALFSAPYFEVLRKGPGLYKLLGLNYFGLLGTLALILVGRASGPTHWSRLRFTVVAASVGLGAWFALGMVHGHLPGADFDARAVVELGWYITPITYALACLGLALASLASGHRQRSLALPLILLCGLSTFIFTWRPTITPDHIWASRRWVPLVIPLLLLFAGLATLQLWQWLRPRWGRAAALLPIALVGLYTLNSYQLARPFAFESMLAGIDDDYRALLSTIDQHRHDKIVLSDNPQLSAFLTYVHDVPTVTVRPIDGWDKAMVQRFEGHTYVTRFGPSIWLHKLAEHQLGGRFLQRTVAAPALHVAPRQALPQVMRGHYQRATVCRITSALANLGENPRQSYGAGAEQMLTRIGHRDTVADTLRTSGKGGVLQYGPYIPLAGGRYVVRWYGTVSGEGTIRGLVSSRKGRKRHASFRALVAPSPQQRLLAALPFVLARDVTDAEFELKVDDGIKLTLHRITLAQRKLVELPARSTSITHPRFNSEVGQRDLKKGTLRSNGQRGMLQFGPYVDLPPGAFSVTWHGTVKRGGPVLVDVVSAKGTAQHSRRRIELRPTTRTGPIAAVAFTLDETTEGVEYRFFVEDSAKVTLERVDFRMH